MPTLLSSPGQDEYFLDTPLLREFVAEVRVLRLGVKTWPPALRHCNHASPRCSPISPGCRTSLPRRTKQVAWAAALEHGYCSAPQIARCRCLAW